MKKYAIYTFKRRFKVGSTPSETNPCIKREYTDEEQTITTKTTNRIVANYGSERYDSWYNHYKSLCLSK
jgi:hypothetical protein